MEVAWKTAQRPDILAYVGVSFYGPDPPQHHRTRLAVWVAWHDLKRGGSWRFV